MKIFYSTRATTQGGRSGRTQLDDGSLALDMAMPGKGAGVNPEQLFAMGYAACFDSALNMVIEKSKLPAKPTTSVQVGIGMKADGSYALDVDIEVAMQGVDQAQAQALVEKAHQVCPYSNATRGNIDVRLHVKAVDA